MTLALFCIYNLVRIMYYRTKSLDFTDRTIQKSQTFNTSNHYWCTFKHQVPNKFATLIYYLENIKYFWCWKFKVYQIQMNFTTFTCYKCLNTNKKEALIFTSTNYSILTTKKHEKYIFHQKITQKPTTSICFMFKFVAMLILWCKLINDMKQCWMLI